MVQYLTVYLHTEICQSLMTLFLLVVLKGVSLYLLKWSKGYIIASKKSKLQKSVHEMISGLKSYIEIYVSLCMFISI